MKAPLQKLELTWIGKGQEFQLEPRILLEQPELAAGDPKAENMLIHGDNLLALKALEQDFAGQIKCIYIDPPYNTGSAFKHYDDGIENSLWLQLLTPRLKLLRSLLAKSGMIFISIDDSQMAYLKVLCDEVFFRQNYCGTLIWEKKRKPSFLSNQIGSITEYILVYAKSREHAPALTFGEIDADETYPLYNAGNSRGTLTFPPDSLKFSKIKDGVYPPKSYKEETSEVNLLTELVIEDGWNKNEIIIEGEWRYSQDAINKQLLTGEYYVVKSDKFRPRRVLLDASGGKKIHNLLSRAHYNMATYEDAAKESVALFGKAKFDYPKPEQLVSFLLDTCTAPGDWVLDSFLGSGTTAAVAHKMGRRWIGVELGGHAQTHCLPRLQKVVAGTDQGGISKAVGWQGGGGFKFYTLAPSLLNKDQYDNWVISKEYNAQMLAAALAKQEGFRYQPDPHTYWKQARSSEHDFLFTTTQFVTVQTIDQLAAQLRPEESLLIACRSYQPACAGHHPRITLKKIPQLLLGRCEFGRDDYSLHIVQVPSPPEAAEDEPSDEAAPAPTPTPTPTQGQLF